MRARLVVVALVCGLTALVHGEMPAVEALLGSGLRFDRAQMDEVGRGKPVAISLAGAMDREILAAGAVRVNAPASSVLALFRDIEQLENKGGFLQTVRLSEPPRLSDFDALVLPQQDVVDLRRCRVGDCKLQLHQRGFDMLATVNWAAPDAAAELNRKVRQMALDVVLAYRAGGALAVGPTLEERLPRDVAGEFAQMMSGKPFLETATPGLAALLTRYPRGARPAGLEETYYWSLIEFGLKKTLRLNHIVIYPLPASGGTRWVLANRQIWASHYFQNGVEIRLLVDAPGSPASAHYLIVLNIARPDGLTGVFGPLVRYKVRSGSRDTLRKTLAITQERAERAAN